MGSPSVVVLVLQSRIDAGLLDSGRRHESTTCSRDTFPESYITEYTFVFEEHIKQSSPGSVRGFQEQTCQVVPSLLGGGS